MITVLSSTHRESSKSDLVADFYASLLTEKGQKTHVLKLKDLPVNFIQEDMFGRRTEAFTKLTKPLLESECLIFVVPEYNGSFPGILKTFMDACDYPGSFAGKSCALVGLSDGKFGNLRGLEHLTGILNYMKAEVLSYRIHLSGIKNELDENGQIFKESTLKMFHFQADKLLNLRKNA